ALLRLTADSAAGWSYAFCVSCRERVSRGSPRRVISEDRHRGRLSQPQHGGRRGVAVSLWEEEGYRYEGRKPDDDEVEGALAPASRVGEDARSDPEPGTDGKSGSQSAFREPGNRRLSSLHREVVHHVHDSPS